MGGFLKEGWIDVFLSPTSFLEKKNMKKIFSKGNIIIVEKNF